MSGPTEGTRHDAQANARCSSAACARSVTRRRSRSSGPTTESAASGEPPGRPAGVALASIRQRRLSRDLDQLSVAKPLPGGKAKVLVTVADVDALARTGRAQHNTTSVYTALTSS
jgi:hypothetical protein